MNFLSGGPIHKFLRGWAIFPFKRTPHYWHPVHRSDGKAFRSVCGIESKINEFAPPLGPGNFPLCKKCKRTAPAITPKEKMTFVEQER
tara:strand:+ start:3300 stop:3563 length:264 start_codon:yes stop_codon:yes gene_type:complete